MALETKHYQSVMERGSKEVVTINNRQINDLDRLTPTACPSELIEENPRLTNWGGAAPRTPVGCSPWIVAALAEVRECAAQGILPAFRRGRMYFDYDWNKVRIAQNGGAA